jgi:hypothetical protein
MIRFSYFKYELTPVMHLNSRVKEKFVLGPCCAASGLIDAWVMQIFILGLNMAMLT